MLFHVSWEFIDTTEEGQKRSLSVFSQWQPPEGADFSKGFYGFSDGSGGVAIVEVDSAATLARTIDPWTPWLRFKATPILPIEESSQLAGEAVVVPRICQLRSHRRPADLRGCAVRRVVDAMLTSGTACGAWIDSYSSS